MKSLVKQAKAFGLDPRGSSELAKETTLQDGRGDCRVMGRSLQPWVNHSNHKINHLQRKKLNLRI